MAEDEVVIQDAPPLIVDHEPEALRIAAAQRAPIQLQVGIRSEDVQVGPRGGQLREGLEALRHVRVVRVEEDHEVARGGASGGVLRRGFAAVVLAQERDPRAEGLESARDVVGGAVIADDHLVWREGLRQRGLDRFPDDVGGLVSRDQNGEPGTIAGFQPFSRRGSEEAPHDDPSSQATVSDTGASIGNDPAPTSGGWRIRPVRPSIVRRRVRLTAYMDSVEIGGAEISLGHLLAGLDPSIEVTMIGVDAAVVDQIAGRRPGTRAMTVTRVGGKADVKPIVQHVRAMRASRPDLVHVNLQSPWEGQYGILAGLLNRRPVVAVE